MTPVTSAGDLVEKLELMAKWLDDGLSHEILSPKPLREAAARILELETKLSGIETCACSYDANGEVCMHHSPALVAAEARNQTLEAALEWYADRVGGVGSWSIEGAKVRADLTEDNGRRAYEALEPSTLNNGEKL